MDFNLLSKDSSSTDFDSLPEGTPLVAIDLGSNSFHLQLARKFHSQIRLIETLGEKVQLAAGLDKAGNLTRLAQLKALECLTRFEPFLRGVDLDNIRVVGTNALREAKNSKEFIQLAANLLKVPVEIISGREEARLIYLGMAHTNSVSQAKRLIIDIGGGSTEFALGQNLDTILLESLQMGCISYKTDFMPDEFNVSKHQYLTAKFAAINEINNIKDKYIAENWQEVWGSSGTVKALNYVINKDFICLEDLHRLEEGFLKRQSIKYFLDIGMRPDRARVIASGLAILTAVFEVLNIDKMQFSTGALREGLLYEMLDSSNFDVRSRTIDSLQSSYGVDKRHSALVVKSIDALWQEASAWNLPKSLLTHLRFAGALHQVGLSVSHHNFHKHGAYLVKYGDLAGFSRQQQDLISFLIRTHRRKFALLEWEGLLPQDKEVYKYGAILIRLAVLFNRSRDPEVFKQIKFTLTVEQKSLKINFSEGFLKNNPLIEADLALEASYLKVLDFALYWN